MNEIKVWNFQDNEVRIIQENCNVLFCGNDVAKALGYTRPNEAIKTHCKGTSKQRILTNGGVQEMLFITEGDIYRLTVRSKLPSAEKFERWVFDEVIPSIRQNGGYIANQDKMSDAELIAKALTIANRIIENKDKLISEMKPKADYFDTVASSKSATTMEEAAKNLDYVNVGRNKLFEILRNEHILKSDNLPYQEYIDRGYFRVIQSKWTDKYLQPQISYKTLVYQKGMNYIDKKLNELGYKKRKAKTVS